MEPSVSRTGMAFPPETGQRLEEQGPILGGTMTERTPEFQRWTAKRKTAVVLEVVKGRATIVDAWRTYGIEQSVARSTRIWIRLRPVPSSCRQFPSRNRSRDREASGRVIALWEMFTMEAYADCEGRGVELAPAEHSENCQGALVSKAFLSYPLRSMMANTSSRVSSSSVGVRARTQPYLRSGVPTMAHRYSSSSPMTQ